MNKIKEVVDKYFAFMQEIGGLFAPEEQVPPGMLDLDRKGDLEYSVFWKPINSTVTDVEIKKLENYFGHELPTAYKNFLKHRHFLELQLGEYGVSFFKSIPEKLVSDTKEEIEEYYWNLIERNYLPFAQLSDYGVVAFNANKESTENDYPIVTLTHEDEYEETEEYAANFEGMFKEFDSHLEDWIQTRKSKEKTPPNNV
ncbi:SMI1/KNR4 family protein [Rufibacter roseus]|uniref:SMI1/KNR4 family protein n=1 Tax=Rufibacter roseus TaxID=1567108 RepID=A0ABW2DSM6_9BACT|nr:SMI1/KNR4 family protein [Rufibacter roseus]